VAAKRLSLLLYSPEMNPLIKSLLYNLYKQSIDVHMILQWGGFAGAEPGFFKRRVKPESMNGDGSSPVGSRAKPQKKDWDELKLPRS